MSFPDIDTQDQQVPLPDKPGCLGPFVLLLLGLTIIGVVATWEAYHYRNAVWANAIFVPEGRLKNDGVLPVLSRRLPTDAAKGESPFVQTLLAEPGGEQLVDTLHLLEMEYVLSVSLEAGTLEGLTAAGRAPEPGKPEVLAGALARFEHFELDGEEFTVTGRMPGSVSSLGFAYLLPAAPAFDELFSADAGAASGSLVPDGLTRVEELFPEEVPVVDEAGNGEDSDSETDEEMRPLAPRALTGARFSWGIGLGLLVTAMGGALLVHRIFRRLDASGPRWVRPLTRDVLAWPRLYWLSHIVLYGVFFAGMAFSMRHPLVNYHIAQFLEHAFTEGELGYIGRAYGSGNILHAAAATFLNNYCLQTLLLTLVASIPPLAFGFLKTALSFALAGLAMSPIWLGTSAHLTYHAVTMVLEFEAYILASFIAVLWPLRLIRGLRSGRVDTEILHGLKTFAVGAVVTAVLLAIAALYEAATLILLRMTG